MLERIIEALAASGDGWILAACALAVIGTWTWIKLANGSPSANASTSVSAQRWNSHVWATGRDLKRLRADRRHPDPRRIYLGWFRGRKMVAEAFRSVLVLASTGAGKTSRYVIAAILGWRGGMFVTSTKGDVLELTEHHRRKKGGTVAIFDSTRPDSIKWTPLSEVKRTDPWGDSMTVAKWLINAAKNKTRGLEGQQFWDDKGADLIAPLVMLYALRGGYMSDIHQAIAHLDTREDKLDAAILDLGPDPYAAWRLFKILDPRTKALVAGTASNVFQAWVHPTVKRAVNIAANDPSGLNIADLLLNQGGTLYAIASAADQEESLPVYKALVGAAVNAIQAQYAATNRPMGKPILLMFDEAGNIASPDNLDTIASSMRGMGVALVSIWQSFGQIIHRYGREVAETILTNHWAKILYGGIDDPDTLHRFGEAVGKDMLTYSIDGETIHREESVANPDFLRRLPEGYGLVIAGTHKAWIGEFPGYHEKRARKDLWPLIPAEVRAKYSRAYSPTKSREKGAA